MIKRLNQSLLGSPLSPPIRSHISSSVSSISAKILTLTGKPLTLNGQRLTIAR